MHLLCPKVGHWNRDNLEGCCGLENPVEWQKQRKNKLGMARGSRNGMNTYCRAWLSRGTRVSGKAHRALRKRE